MKNDKARTMRIDLIREIPEVPLSVAPQSARPASGILIRAAVPHAPETPQGGASRYDGIFQNLYDAAIVADMHGRIREVNPRATAAFGHTPAEFTHLTMQDIVRGADVELIRTLFENLRRERFSLLQASCTRKDGTTFPAEISVSALQLSTPHLCFLIRDETVRCQTDDMLRTEHKALQNASDAIVVASADATIEYANPATAAIWGFSDAGELVGKPLGTLFLNEEDGKSIVESLSGETYQTTGDAIARRANGDSFRVEIHAACNRDANGAIVGAVISFSDLSERDRALSALRESETVRECLHKLETLHRSVECDVEELHAFLENPAVTAALAPHEALRPSLASALGSLEGLRSLSAEMRELLQAASKK